MIILTHDERVGRELSYRMAKTLQMLGLPFKPLNLKVATEVDHIRGLNLHGKMVMSMLMAAHSARDSTEKVLRLEREAMVRGAEVWRIDNMAMKEASLHATAETDPALRSLAPEV